MQFHITQGEKQDTGVGHALATGPLVERMVVGAERFGETGLGPPVAVAESLDKVGDFAGFHAPILTSHSGVDKWTI